MEGCRQRNLEWQIRSSVLDMLSWRKVEAVGERAGNCRNRVAEWGEEVGSRAETGMVGRQRASLQVLRGPACGSRSLMGVLFRSFSEMRSGTSESEDREGGV